MSAKGRYEIREVLGEGGMGIVYRAFDPVMKREVTVKTIRDPQDKAVLELFRRECAVLASMTHPNIVEIFDIGETEEAGARRPYFVMPLLRGETLQKLIETSSPRLTIERSVQMMTQACRGLQAAHEQGLVHRDLKPSNLFVLSDDSVKIIDFGVAHLANQHSLTGMKGTLPYMAPEQLRMKQPTPLSDQFSIAVVCYEMLARRRPFNPVGGEDIAQAILNHSPAPVSELNPLVSAAISQVIHKALAKEPFYRFSSVREFSECLQKASRGEAIDKFDPARITPRLDRARKAFDSGDLDDASEILSELESANYLAPEIQELRRQVDDTRRTKTVRQLMETARRRFDEGEYLRALQKVQEVLDLDANNTDAYTLKGAIETRHSAIQIDEWFRLANEHLENHAYAHARQALEKVLDLRPQEPRAQSLLAEVERREQEYVRLRSEKQQAYESALDAYKRGDLISALHKLDRVLDLDRRGPHSTSPEQGSAYQKLYEAVRTKSDQVASKEAEARRHLNDGDFPAAMVICEEVLVVYPNNVVFRVLRDDVEQAQRQEISAYVAKIEKEVAAEPDLNRKVSILEEARKKYPDEQRFQQSLQQVCSRRDLVDSIAVRARAFEEARQFPDALGQWETLRNIYPKLPGLEIEIDRVKKRREQQALADTKAHWITQIDQALSVHNYGKAISLIAEATAEFPSDAELAAMKRQAEQARDRASNAEEKANRGKELHANGQVQEALALLREAAKLAPHNPLVRGHLLETILKEARIRVDNDWQAAEGFVQEALDIDSGSPEAKSLSTLIQDKRRAEDISAVLSTARELQSTGQLKDALDAIDKVVVAYPRESRLIQFRESLWRSLPVEHRAEIRAKETEVRARALDEVSKLATESNETSDVEKLESIFAKSREFSRYGEEAEFQEPLRTIEKRLYKKREAEKAEDVSEPPEPPRPPDESRSRKGLPRIWAFSGVMKNLVWAGVSFVVIAALIWFVLRRPQPVLNSGQKLASVEIRNAGPGEYKVTAGDTDVTASLSGGLPAGDYELDASKPGFQAVKLRFSVDPSKEPRKVLEVKFQALPAVVNLQIARVTGSLKLDGVDHAFDGNGEFRTEWSNGSHLIHWETASAESVEIGFEVNGEAITVKDPVVHGYVGVMLATLGKTQVAYQAVNIPGGITKLVDDQPEPLPSAGTFPLPQSAQRVMFKAKSNGFPLGGFQVAKDGGSMIYVYVSPQPRLPVKPAPPPSAPNAGGKPPAVAVEPSPAPLSEEELRQQEAVRRKQEYLKKLKEGK
jgi:eukaryotic-like serine/threonine-protein kinase